MNKLTGIFPALVAVLVFCAGIILGICIERKNIKNYTESDILEIQPQVSPEAVEQQLISIGAEPATTPEAAQDKWVSDWELSRGF